MENIDLTMLARSAYRAILKNIEEVQKDEKTQTSPDMAGQWHADRMERLGVTEAEMWEAGPNMMVAADFLAELFRIYGDDLGAVLMYYNGDGRLEGYLAGGELSWYAASVIDMAEVLEDDHYGC